MRQQTITTSGIKLITEDCCVCGVVFALPESMLERRSKQGGDFYCPNGHCLHYTETELQRLRHQLDQREAELERTHGRLDGALKEITNKQRVITRMKNRIHAGVCTECHRHFENLERHMKSKHSS